MLMQHTDSPAATKFAEEKGIYAFGQASDMAQFGPNAQLTSIIDDWNPYYLERVKALLDGTWKSGDTWDGMREGTVVMAPWSKKMPPDVVKLAEDARNAIAAGKLHPFTGPIKKQDGSVWLKEGEKASDKDLLSMNFYVEGVEGSLPK
jgi:simple sugar transport system substrate-binding protein